jgi:hypothetical protein
MELIAAVLLEQAGDPGTPAAGPDESELDLAGGGWRILGAARHGMKDRGTRGRTEKPAP